MKFGVRATIKYVNAHAPDSQRGTHPPPPPRADRSGQTDVDAKKYDGDFVEVKKGQESKVGFSLEGGKRIAGTTGVAAQTH